MIDLGHLRQPHQGFFQFRDRQRHLPPALPAIDLRGEFPRLVQGLRQVLGQHLD
jgi:hypothetical protein